MHKALSALGADYRQWRGLLGPLLKVGFRSSWVVAQLTQRGRNPRLVSFGTVFFLGFLGVFLIPYGVLLADPFSIALLATGAVALIVVFMLLIDFQAVAVSPPDYQVLGHRPVSERTYLAARLTVTTAHQLILAGLVAGPSVILCGLRFGWPAALGLAVAAALLTVSIVLALVGVYGTLIRRIGPRRLGRSMAYAQVLMTLVYVLPLLLLNVGEQGLQSPQAPELGGWLLALPLAWFAGLVPLFHGELQYPELLAAGLAVATVSLLAWYARDKMSLSSAQKLAAAIDADPPPPGRSGRRRLAGLLPARLEVAALLIRGQFRHDNRFRMSIFAMLPLLAVYAIMALRIPGTVDPFVAGANSFSLVGIHMAVFLAPVIMLEELYRADSYRAGWVFFSTPMDRARLAADARHCVTLFFFLPYLALAGLVLFFLFETAWHVLPHLFVLGCLGVFGMQLSQFMVPRLPFSMAPGRKRHGVLLFGFAFFFAVIGSLLGSYLKFAYARPPWAIGTIAGLLLGVTLMERQMPGRLQRRLRWQESEG